MFAHSEAKRCLEHIRKLRSVMDEGAFVIPRALSFDQAHQVLWLEAVSGRALTPGTATRQDIAKVAIGLASLQQVPLQDIPALTTENYLAEALKKLDKLHGLCPGQAPALSAVRQFLLTQAPHESTLPNCTLHGDFHYGQMLQTAAGIALFDYDELQRGDPLVDVANFLVALGNETGETTLKRWQTTFIEAYAAAVPWPVCHDRLRWHLAIQYLTRAYRAFLQQVPDLMQRLPALLLQSHALIGRDTESANGQPAPAKSRSTGRSLYA
jgi:aminoglycoside phosphotransferase (APT) family kinase protein